MRFYEFEGCGEAVDLELVGHVEMARKNDVPSEFCGEYSSIKLYDRYNCLIMEVAGETGRMEGLYEDLIKKLIPEESNS